MRTALLVPIGAIIGVASAIAAIATIAIAVRVESRRLDRPPAGEAATDLGES